LLLSSPLVTLLSMLRMKYILRAAVVGAAAVSIAVVRAAGEARLPFI
jgi:hypothetical protein